MCNEVVVTVRYSIFFSVSDADGMVQFHTLFFVLNVSEQFSRVERFSDGTERNIRKGQVVQHGHSSDNLSSRNGPPM